MSDEMHKVVAGSADATLDRGQIKECLDWMLDCFMHVLSCLTGIYTAALRPAWLQISAQCPLH